jgi:hypothetical protein
LVSEYPLVEISVGVSGRGATWPFNAVVAALTVATVLTNANVTAARPANIFDGKWCIFIEFEFCLGLQLSV